MDGQHDISVVISTYNRCEMLRAALESIVAQRANGTTYEVIVVDNNSTDETRGVVEAFAGNGHAPVRYVLEERQGVSHARNAGILNARAPIVAFFDDDVRVSPDWVATIKRLFDSYRNADCLGGKVLPIWEQEPPAWLTRDHWAPLALQDYGDAPLVVDAANPICLISANLAFRRASLERIGLFGAALQRVKGGIGSMEDYELLVRLWNAGGHGVYVPELIAHTVVTADRLAKKYHRRWHTGHGHFYALMRAEEMEQGAARLFDVPAHLYRKALSDAAGWLVKTFSGKAGARFAYETELRFFQGFFRERYREFRSVARHSTVGEIASFARSLLRSKTARQDARVVR